MFPERILLTDKFRPLCQAWTQAFAKHTSVEVIDGDFFAQDADLMVSPANSFGIMDGGLDAAIRDELAGDVQRIVQNVILERHHGELPVGACEIVATGHRRWPHLAVAPTMRVPESVANTVNAYLAFRATLLAVVSHNQRHVERPIRSLVVPGLGTGVGAMDPRRCAAQMRIAFDQVKAPAGIPSFKVIHQTHQKLRNAL